MLHKLTKVGKAGQITSALWRKQDQVEHDYSHSRLLFV